MDFLSSKVVKTRKPHRCYGCLRLFPSRRKLTYTVCADAGEIVDGYICVPCNKEYHREGWRDGYYDGDLGESRIQRARDYIYERGLRKRG